MRVDPDGPRAAGVAAGALVHIGARGDRRALSLDARVSQRLNPSAQFAAGEQIQVPNVEPFIAPVEKPDVLAAPQKEPPRPAGTTGRRDEPAPKQPNTVAERPDVVVTVSKANSALTVQDGSGEDHLLRAGDHRQRARSAAARRVEGQRDSDSTRRSTTTPSCSGTPIRRTQRRSCRRARTIPSASSGSI